MAPSCGDWSRKHWICLSTMISLTMILIIGTSVAVALISDSSDETNYISTTTEEVTYGPILEYQVEGQEIHNEKRAPHGSLPLELSPRLNLIATNCARHYIEAHKASRFVAHDCPYKNTKKGVGENLLMETRTWNATEAVKYAVSKWYAEGNNYDYSHPHEFEEKAGEFTQFVWKNTKSIGIGHDAYTATDGTGRYVVVGIYDPPGNRPGEYEHNVLRPREDPSPSHVK